MLLLQIGELGHGTFGVVVKALDLREKPSREVAIKLLSRGPFVSTTPSCALARLAIKPHKPIFKLSCSPGCAAAGTVTLASKFYCLLVKVMMFYVFLQIKNYKTYVKREIDNQSRLRHPLIVSIQEVLYCSTAWLRAGVLLHVTCLEEGCSGLHSVHTVCISPGSWRVNNGRDRGMLSCTGQRVPCMRPP